MVVVEEGYWGRMVVSSVVVVLLLVVVGRGASEAQPDSASMVEARTQIRKIFFMIGVLSQMGGALLLLKESAPAD